MKRFNQEHKAALFDHAAKIYDEQFTNSNIGQLQRKRLYELLSEFGFFYKSKKIFEINCGTGADAIFFSKKGHEIIATDASEKMIEIAKSKINQSINFYPLTFENLKNDVNFKKSEVLFSNFGGLNCLSPSGLKEFFLQVAASQKKGNQVIFVLMSKKCMIENLYFFLKGEWSKMNRRNTSKAVEVNVNGQSIATYYYLPKEIIELLQPHYKINFIKPLAFFLPPSYLEPFFNKRKNWLKLIYYFEKRIAKSRRFASLADHYLLIAEHL